MQQLIDSQTKHSVDCHEYPDEAQRREKNKTKHYLKLKSDHIRTSTQERILRHPKISCIS
jgi:hypothetical protein